MPRDLISAKTRQEFREYFVTTSLATIDDAFRAEGLQADRAHEPPVGGQRRSLVEQYYRTVDWRDPSQVARVLRVYEAVLVALDLRAISHADNADGARETAVALRRWLTRDGIRETEGRLELPGHQTLHDALTTIDAPELQRQIDRMRGSVESDPGLAIGTAKELVETVCKTILSERGCPPDPGWDLPRLVKETRQVLSLLPADMEDPAKGAESIRRVLNSLGTVANGLAELRNLYGDRPREAWSGQGRPPPTRSLGCGNRRDVGDLPS